MVKALAIVAHPDDETIWCGGTILSHPRWDWAILSLCRRDDTNRAPKFAKACAELKAKCAMSDLEDEHPEQPLADLEEVKRRVREMLRGLRIGTSFDFLFTHGCSGEYGHNRHKETHRAVNEMLAGGELSAKKIFFFSYRRAEHGNYCVAERASKTFERALNARSAGKIACETNRAGKNCGRGAQRGGKIARVADKIARGERVSARLSARTARQKRLLITSLYQFSKDGFEARSARAIEAFRVKAQCDQ